MAQGRPPRHSKSKRDPVTIDLEAEKSATPDAPSGETSKPASGPAVPTASTEDAAASPSSSRDPGSAAAAGTSSQKPAAEPQKSSAATSTSDAGAEKPAASSARATATAGAPKAAASSSATSASAAGTPRDTAGKDRQAAGKPHQASKAQARAHEAAAFRLAKTADAQQPPQKQAAPSSTGGGRGFVAGLVGGVIVVAGTYLLQGAGVLTVPGAKPQDTAQIESQVASLRQDVDGLKSLAAKAPASTAGSDVSGKVDALSKRIDALESKTASADTGDVSDLKNQLSQVQTAAKQDSSDIASLTQRVDGIEKKLSQPSDAMKLARTVAAGGLRSAIDRGGPFQSELRAYQGVAPDDADAKSLQEVAGKGVKSQQALIDSYPDVADSILSATSGNDEDAGVLDRLWSGAQSIVKVRPTGNPQGNSPDAIVARMGTRLKAGDLSAVVGEWSKLPDAGQKASQAFIDDVKARMKAQDAVNRIMASSTKQEDATGGNGQAQ